MCNNFNCCLGNIFGSPCRRNRDFDRDRREDRREDRRNDRREDRREDRRDRRDCDNY